METLRTYLNAMRPPEQEAFARRCGTSIGYLRKALSTGEDLRAELCLMIESESVGAVRCESLRPELPWSVLRGTAANDSSPAPLAAGGAHA